MTERRRHFPAIHTPCFKLKIRKCCVVPLAIGRRGIPTAIKAARRPLAAAAPACAGMHMASSTCYLGLLIGPAAGADDQWRTALGEHARRTAALAGARRAPILATRENNLRVASLASYVAQVVAPASGVTVTGRRAATRLLHLPHSSLPATVCGRLDDFGLMLPRHAGLAAWATLIATAPVWRPALQRLHCAADDGARLAQLNDDEPCLLGMERPRLRVNVRQPHGNGPTAAR